jgi:hypothetical protein
MRVPIAIASSRYALLAMTKQNAARRVDDEKSYFAFS